MKTVEVMLKIQTFFTYTKEQDEYKEEDKEKTVTSLGDERS